VTDGDTDGRGVAPEEAGVLGGTDPDGLGETEDCGEVNGALDGQYGYPRLRLCDESPVTGSVQ
jgi:hypothetical protein